MQTLRTFIAIPIKTEPQLGAVWTKFRQRYGSNEVKWANPDTLHLTLFFLGKTPLEAINKIQHEIIGVLNGFGSFSFTLKGLGYFGQKNNPKVIWVGAERNEEFTRLHALINNKVSNFGFKPDERGFNPHITLGRPKHLNNSNAFLFDVNKYVNTVFQVSEATEVIHYNSEFRLTGPIYTRLYSIVLG
jgi:RNA 2',3'-cyclic 3'-phosphodiesterase